MSEMFDGGDDEEPLVGKEPDNTDQNPSRVVEEDKEELPTIPGVAEGEAKIELALGQSQS